MTGAMLLEVVRRWAGKALVLAVVVLLVLAVMGVIDWWSVLALWCLWLILAVTHATTHELEAGCKHSRPRSWCSSCDVQGGVR